MLWLKALHIIFVVTWFAGLFYLPRLFVYHCQCREEPGLERFKTMERKLFIIMTIGAVPSLVFGLWLRKWWAPALSSGELWLYLKLVLVAGLIGFHAYCWHLVKMFRDDQNHHTERYYRIINEIPAIALIGIVILVVVKPI